MYSHARSKNRLESCGGCSKSSQTDIPLFSMYLTCRQINSSEMVSRLLQSPQKPAIGPPSSSLEPLVKAPNQRVGLLQTTTHHDTMTKWTDDAVRDCTCKVIPFISCGLLFSFTGISLIYSFHIQTAVPQSTIMVISILFAIFALIFISGSLYMYIKRKMQKKYAIDDEERPPPVAEIGPPTSPNGRPLITMMTQEERQRLALKRQQAPVKGWRNQPTQNQQYNRHFSFDRHRALRGASRPPGQSYSGQESIGPRSVASTKFSDVVRLVPTRMIINRNNTTVVYREAGSFKLEGHLQQEKTAVSDEKLRSPVDVTKKQVAKSSKSNRKQSAPKG
jgi:hypothetical protein